MVTLYASPSCTSCRKAKQWLENHDIPYVERNLNKTPLSVAEIKAMLLKVHSVKQCLMLFEVFSTFISVPN